MYKSCHKLQTVTSSAKHPTFSIDHWIVFTFVGTKFVLLIKPIKFGHILWHQGFCVKVHPSSSQSCHHKNWNHPLRWILYIFQTASNENVIYPGCWRPEYDGIAGSRSQRGSLGLYGDYGCDTPWELVESAVKAMATRQDVDFLLWTGWVVYIEITGSILSALYALAESAENVLRVRCPVFMVLLNVAYVLHYK